MSQQPKKQSALERYIPWAGDADNLVSLLEKMGVPEFEFGNVLRGNAVHVYGQLLNPDSGVVFSIGIATIQIKPTESRFDLAVNDVPYRQFFRDLEEEDARIAEAAARNEIIARLWEENRRLKQLLGKTWRAVP